MSAVEQQIKDQQQFIAWWDANVRADGRPVVKTSADRRTFLQMEEAETLTGIRNQQVSCWRKRLGELPNLAAQTQAIKDAAKERQREHQGTAPGKKKHLPSREGKCFTVAEAIAKTTGISRGTVERMDQAVRLAPERLSDLAAGLRVLPVKISGQVA